LKKFLSDFVKGQLFLFITEGEGGQSFIGGVCALLNPSSGAGTSLYRFVSEQTHAIKRALDRVDVFILIGGK
jgi:hypothetical protein